MQQKYAQHWWKVTIRRFSGVRKEIRQANSHHWDNTHWTRVITQHCIVLRQQLCIQCIMAYLRTPRFQSIFPSYVTLRVQDLIRRPIWHDSFDCSRDRSITSKPTDPPPVRSAPQSQPLSHYHITLYRPASKVKCQVWQSYTRLPPSTYQTLHVHIPG